MIGFKSESQKNISYYRFYRRRVDQSYDGRFKLDERGNLANMSLTDSIARRFAESVLSRRNFNPIAGIIACRIRLMNLWARIDLQREM